MILIHIKHDEGKREKCFAVNVLYDMRCYCVRDCVVGIAVSANLFTLLDSLAYFLLRRRCLISLRNLILNTLHSIKIFVTNSPYFNFCFQTETFLSAFISNWLLAKYEASSKIVYLPAALLNDFLLLRWRTATEFLVPEYIMQISLSLWVPCYSNIFHVRQKSIWEFGTYRIPRFPNALLNVKTLAFRFNVNWLENINNVCLLFSNQKLNFVGTFWIFRENLSSIPR